MKSQGLALFTYASDNKDLPPVDNAGWQDIGQNQTMKYVHNVNTRDVTDRAPYQRPFSSVLACPESSQIPASYSGCSVYNSYTFNRLVVRFYAGGQYMHYADYGGRFAQPWRLTDYQYPSRDMYTYCSWSNVNADPWVTTDPYAMFTSTHPYHLSLRVQYGLEGMYREHLEGSNILLLDGHVESFMQGALEDLVASKTFWKE
jgi:prepilin-type processing-associated H-X9-DG protein